MDAKTTKRSPLGRRGPRRKNSGTSTTALCKRLSRCEGQIRGIAGMVEGGRDAVEILTQIAAAQAGLRAVAKEVLKERLALAAGDAAAGEDLAEITELIFRYAR